MKLHQNNKFKVYSPEHSIVRGLKKYKKERNHAFLVGMLILGLALLIGMWINY